MSTPNDPDKNQPTSPPNGTGPASGSAGASGAGASGTPRSGGLVPPWQRGPKDIPAGGGESSPNEGSLNGSSRPGPPPRGVVSAGSPAPSAQGANGAQAPVTKLDSSPRPAPSSGGTPGGASSPKSAGGFVESPTRTIVRDPSDDEQLPDLDLIHHTDARRVPPQAAQATAAPRPVPTQVGSSAGLRASVQVRRIDPWATFKITAVLSVAGFFIWMISVAVLYLVLDGMGVWDQVNSSFGTLVTADGSSSSGDIIGAGTVFGYAALLGAVNAILLTALATVGAYIYNLCADMIGGAEVTLADLD